MSKTRSLLPRVGDFQQVTSAMWRNMPNLTRSVPRRLKTSYSEQEIEPLELNFAK